MLPNKIVYRNLGANCGERNIYLRSTDIERMNWEFLLLSIPDELLYFMSLGKKIVIEDRSSKKAGKIQRIFCPVFSDFIRYLNKKHPIHVMYKQHYKKTIQAYENNKLIHRKYRFFKKKFKTISIRGRTIKMNKEPSVW